MRDEKPGLAILIGKRIANKQKGLSGEPLSDEGDEKEGGEKDDMLSSAVSDFIDAIKDGDDKAAKDALIDAIHLCAEEDEPEEPSDDDKY